jgi:hypothetical protein
MPHIHVPKPLHGWREFVGEVSVIVLGVLIALAAEELVVEWTWERKVDAGEEELRSEQQVGFGYLAEFITVAPCLDAQIEALRSHLTNERTYSAPVPLITDNTMSGVMRAPWRPISDGVWQSLVSEGTVTHMKTDRQKWAVQYYTQMKNYSVNQEGLRDRIQRLRVLADPLPIDPHSRIALLMDLATMRSEVSDNVLVGRQMMATISRLGNAPPEEDQLESGTLAYCKAHGLPIGDWKAHLAIGMTETV